MKPVAKWTMDELLERYPEAVSVLVSHDVSPHTRCNHAVRHYLTLKQALGRACPVDDATRTLADLESWVDARGSAR